MEKAKKYIQLHLNILLFSLTGIFQNWQACSIISQGLIPPGCSVFGTDDLRLRHIRSGMGRR